MKVLIALDNSQYSTAALDAVLGRPWWGDDEFMVVNVVQILTPAYDGPVYYPQYYTAVREEELKNSQKLVDNAAEKLSKVAPSAHVTRKVIEGNVCVEIVNAAREWNADLIVVGSHGRRGLSKFLIGSVAEGVMHQAPCSVEIIKMRNVSEEIEKAQPAAKTLKA